MAKYRIIQRNDGYYCIQYRVLPFIWKRYISYETQALYPELEDTESDVQKILNAKKVRKEKRVQKGIKKVVKYF